MISNTLISPQECEDEVARSSRTPPKFHECDLGSVSLVKGMKFASAALFRAVVKEANIAMEKNVCFKKNRGDKVVIVCRTKKCGYRVYGRMIYVERSFKIWDIQPRHKCPR